MTHPFRPRKCRLDCQGYANSSGLCPAHKASQDRVRDGRPLKRTITAQAQYALGMARTR